MSTDGAALSLAKRWVHALCAPRHDSKEVVVRGGRGEPSARAWLADVQGVNGRREAMVKLRRVSADGMQANYAQKRAWWQSLPAEASSVGFRFMDADEQRGRAFIQVHGGQTEESSIVALDVAAQVQFSGFAYAAAYVAEHEASAALLAAANLARATYDSWAAYGRAFVYGTWFWAGHVDANVVAMEKKVAELLADVASPWCTLPWDVDLSPLHALTVEPGDPGGPLSSVSVRVFVDCPECLHPTLLPDTSPRARCHSCGASLDHLTARAWQHATHLGDRIELDASEEAAAEAERRETGVRQLAVIDHPRVRVVHTRRPASCSCGSPFADALVRASVREHGGVLTCACGNTVAVGVAPDTMREADFRARYVLGGPLRIGEPHGLVTLFFSQG